MKTNICNGISKCVLWELKCGFTLEGGGVRLQRPGVCFARHRFRSEMISSDLKEHLLACVAIFLIL